MSKKQNKIFKILPIIITALIMASFSNAMAKPNHELTTADSLFRLQKYTESFELYEKIMDEKNEASPQMLMKMAYIKEGLGDYSQALIYLNKYFMQTSDKRAQNKMHELAEEHELSGFAVSDTTFFKGLINKYYIGFNLIIFGIALFFAAVFLFRKWKSKPNAAPFGLVTVVILLVFYWVINFQLDEPQGIITENYVYLMTGPSAGADLVEVIKKGHRLNILSEEGVWVKVDWKGQEVYIRSTTIKRIS
ncbi:MAG: SH3 domain-containing protein [Reichenbachiella sp.]|uniref:SH3 domain-containing protein n=1 Tax=Reichenbachiella sp. TaxID=2184521 RepID=UPI003263A90E